MKHKAKQKYIKFYGKFRSFGIHRMLACATGTPLTPNDTWFANPPPTFNFPQWALWGPAGIDADLAWSDLAGDPSVVVVAMDSGVRYYHRDLGGNDPPGPADNVTNGNVWINSGEIPGNGFDDDGNGRIDDVVGWDFVSGVTGCSTGEDCSTQDNDPRDFNGHGTHTAGTMRPSATMPAASPGSPEGGATAAPLRRATASRLCVCGSAIRRPSAVWSAWTSLPKR